MKDFCLIVCFIASATTANFTSTINKNIETKPASDSSSDHDLVTRLGNYPSFSDGGHESYKPRATPHDRFNVQNNYKIFVANSSYYEMLAKIGKNKYHFNPYRREQKKNNQQTSVDPAKISDRMDVTGGRYNFNPSAPSKSSNNNNLGNHHLLDLHYEEECGLSLSLNSLIMNGNKVQMGVYPWLAAIFRVKGTGVNYICSGSLISNKHIVTAGHCVHSERSKKLPPSELLVILGKVNLKRWVPTSTERIIEPESIAVHPDYEPLTSDADIAVITLSETVHFTKFIKPLCLWKENNDIKEIIGEYGTVAGWGKDQDGNLMTAEPKQTTLPVVSQEQCLSSSYQFQYVTSNRTFCAGSRDGVGPCNGDSGSGFIMKRGGKWTLRGIVSMSVSDSNLRSCDLKNYVVFTDASKFIFWLIDFLK